MSAADDATETLQQDDLAARRAAQRCFDRPLVIEAGAGTGKTTALVARIVVFALGPGWERARERVALRNMGVPPAPDLVAAEVLHRIVAITFTEAAAAEMAERTGEAFGVFARGETPAWLLAADLLPADADERIQRARALGSALDRLVVRTIHAFCRRLLAAHPLEAGLHPAFEVDADESAVAEVARQTLELRLREGYGEPGDPALLALATLGAGPAELEQELVKLLQADTPVEALLADPFEARRVAGFRDQIVDRYEKAGSLLERSFGKGTKWTRPFVEGLQSAAGELRGFSGEGAAAAKRVAEIAFEALKGGRSKLADWRKGKFSAEEAGLLDGDAPRDVCALSDELCRLRNHLASLDPPRLDLARRALAPMLATAHAELRARGVVTFTRLLHGAQELLAKHPLVAARERAQIDQLLVDEFQDTDDVQCALVETLVFGGDADRPGLFVVGDPKQSIYGWRSADLASYERFVARVCAENGAQHRLVTNHRSVRAILDEVERVIDPVMEEDPGIQPRFQRLLSARDARGEIGHEEAPRCAVEHWDSRGSATGETRTEQATRLEAQALAADLAVLLFERKVPGREVGILLRGLGDLEIYLTALRHAGIPYAVERDRAYYRRREIVDAAALIRCVIDPADAIALLSFLRAPGVGVPDAALIPLWAGRLPDLVARLPEEGVLQRIRRVASEAAAVLSDRDDVPGLAATAGWDASLVAALEALSALRCSFAVDPPERFLERLRTWLLPEATESVRLLGAFRLANLDRLFRELGQTLAEGADPAAALRRLRTSVQDQREAQEGRPRDGADDAVRVMSIHGAKGLAFRHTYVMQLHRGGSVRNDRRACAVRVGEDYEICLWNQSSLGFEAVDERRRRIDRAEQVRTLYVAMTRARDRLVLSGCRGARPRNRSDEANHLGLLAKRRSSEALDLAATMEDLGKRGVETHVDADAVGWRFPALPGSTLPAPRSRFRIDPAVAAARARADEAQLASHRAFVAARNVRALGGPASASAHEALRMSFEARHDEADLASEGTRRERNVPGIARDVSARVGTAIHRALEGADAEGDPAVVQRALVDVASAVLAAQVDGASHAQAMARARDLIERFCAGPLLPRLRAITPHIVARELPVLLAPGSGASEPLAYLAGSIDLVYVDSATAELVVVDYKTDEIETESEIAQRVAGYAAQGAVYVRALTESLGLVRTPRFELWFLHAGRIEVVAPTP